MILRLRFNRWEQAERRFRAHEWRAIEGPEYETLNDVHVSLQDTTKGWTFTQTVPYPSTHGSAEWIEETPLLLGTDAGFAALPNLTNPAFSNAKVNGANANLQTSEQMQLIDSNGKVIGAPSAPNATRDGFSACTWASSC